MLPDVHQADRRATSRRSRPTSSWRSPSTRPTRQPRPALPEQLRAAAASRTRSRRLPGVSDVSMLGQRDYSMRIWVDPEKLAARNMTAGDVVHAIREQNQQVATGQIGQQPAPTGQPIQVPLSTLGPADRCRAVREHHRQARPEDGRRPPDQGRRPGRARGQEPGHQLPGQRQALGQPGHLPAPRRQRPRHGRHRQGEDGGAGEGVPAGRRLRDPLRHHAVSSRESIDEVFKTLREAIILVAVVVLLFLQNWRSAIIPLIAVPVAIVGTFAVMAALGFSLNNLTLFGLVLAIGIVVDDAIVVVEAVEHHIEHGMAPRDATIRAMEEVSGPVIAIGLVLTAVFVPCAFITRDRRPVLPPVRADDRRLDDHLGVQLADPEPGPGGAAAAAEDGGLERTARRCRGWLTPARRVRSAGVPRCRSDDLLPRARRRFRRVGESTGSVIGPEWFDAGVGVAGALGRRRRRRVGRPAPRLARSAGARPRCSAASSGCSTTASSQATGVYSGSSAACSASACSCSSSTAGCST